MIKAIRKWGRTHKNEANLICLFIMIAWFVAVPFIFVLYDMIRKGNF